MCVFTRMALRCRVLAEGGERTGAEPMAVRDQAAASSQCLVSRIANSRRSGWEAAGARAAHRRMTRQGAIPRSRPLTSVAYDDEDDRGDLVSAAVMGRTARSVLLWAWCAASATASEPKTRTG
jgi:hypothetical protein